MNIMHMYYLTSIMGIVTFISSCVMLYKTDQKNVKDKSKD
ncbi:hypothetical protein BCI9360_01701 [Bacillus sp. CECT 9360]|nr:hypothetical protein BCI9360_01701 [Bacillus sp. CECT 9360]